MRVAIFVLGICLSVSALARQLASQILLAKIQKQNSEYNVNRLTKWKYKGRTFYELKNSKCCDIPDVLFDEKGERYCILGGGLANRTDPQCADFLKEGVKEFLGYLTDSKGP